MRKEFEDIENLEKLGMKALFYKVLGSQEEQLEKERQEYLQASLKYDQVRKTPQNQPSCFNQTRVLPSLQAALYPIVFFPLMYYAALPLPVCC